MQIDDARFAYDGPVNWKLGGKQILHGSEYTTMENNNQFAPDGQPTKLEFEIDTEKPILCDLNTRFRVQGEFQVQAAAVGSPWVRCAPDEYKKVIVAPCWWEILIRNIELFHANYHVKTHDIPFNSDSHLNQFLYWAMDPVLKKNLCLEPAHPGNAVPQKKGTWNFEEDSDWHTYSKSIFTNGQVVFHWNPMFLWPFWQSSNHVYDDKAPRCVPINFTGKLLTRLSLKDNYAAAIFKKKDPATDLRKFRFVLNKMDLAVEEARLSPLIEKKLYGGGGGGKLLYYPGITKIAHFETVNEGSFIFQSKFESIPMPESVLIYCLPKSVPGDNYKFQDHDLAEPFFIKHNISQVTFNFGGLNYTLKEPNFGSIKDDVVDAKNLFDYTKYGPFGLFFDQTKLSKHNIADGFLNTDFPHVYVNLSTSAHNRLIPLLDSGSVLAQNHDFNVTVKCTTDAVAKATYIIYCIYSDVNMSLDLKDKKFENPLLKGKHA